MGNALDTMMGATRPSRAQWEFQAAKAEASWNKHLKSLEPAKAGYNPDMVRRTCDHCNNLTWHDHGDCVECTPE